MQSVCLKLVSVRLVGIVVLFLAFSNVAWSQGYQGTIQGDVRDESGAFLPGAKVTITSVATGETRSQLTSDSGVFSFPGLLVSAYSVTVEFEGFKKYTRENVQVSANTVSDVVARMELGPITEQAIVTATEERIQLSTAQLSFSTRNVVSLPNSLATGNPNNFAILAPGTTTMPGGVAGQGGSVGGQRPRANNFVVDGTDNNDPSTTGTLTPVIADAVEEFILLTNQFRAEYGHSSAGQFITTTRSGGKKLEGRAWWYNQNRNTNSLDNLTRATMKPEDPKPRYDWNRFGGQAGGPIVKGKWFFFTAYEYQNKTLAGSASSQIIVPTAAGLAALANLAGDPATGVSPVNVGLLTSHVPVATVASTSANVLNEGTGSMVPIELGPFSATTPNFDRTHLFQFNSDYEIRGHRLSGRYSYSRNPFVVPGTLPVEEFNSNVSINTQRIVFGDVFSIGRRAVNEFRASYNRNIEDRAVDPPPAPGQTDIFGNYGLRDRGLFIGPIINPNARKTHLYTFSDNTSVVMGAHTVKFGVEVRNILAQSDFLSRSRGEYTWPDLDEFVRDRFPTVTAIRGTGQGAYAQNRTSYYAFAQDTWKIHRRVTLEYGVRYEFTTAARDESIQDLNGLSNLVSVRDEIVTADMVSSATPPVGSVVFNTLPNHHQQAILSLIGEQLLFRQPKNDGNNFAPRLGLSWDMFGDGKTSLRAGAGVAHDVFYGNLGLLLLPPQVQAENRESNACLLSPKPSWCAFVTGNQVANAANSANVRYSTIGFIEGGGLLPLLPPGTRINRFTARTATGTWMGPKDVSPETYTWSLSVQREQFKNVVIEVRYIGNHSMYLPVQRQLNVNVPNPVRLPLFLSQTEALANSFTGAPNLDQFNKGKIRILSPYGFAGALTTLAPEGQSWYNGGSVSVEGRVAPGLFLNTSYTFSKTTDLVENDLNTSVLNPRRPKDAYDLASNKALSGLHRTHKFVASWIYDLPAYRGPGPLRKVFSQWQLTGSFILESGQPVSILSGNDANGDGDSIADTAFFNPAGQANTGSDVDYVCWNGTTVTFEVVITGACGADTNIVGYVAKNPGAQYIRTREGMVANLGRNTFVMPGINTLNLSLFKSVDLQEGVKLQLRVEMYNVFNHPSYTLGSGTFLGQSASTSPARTATGYVTPGSSQFLNPSVLSGGLGNVPFQRIVQWGAKLTF